MRACLAAGKSQSAPKSGSERYPDVVMRIVSIAGNFFRMPT
jgi:hypothetical protein